MIWSTFALSKEVEKGEVKLLWTGRFCFDLKTGKCGEDCDSEPIYLDSNSGPIADDCVPWASFLTSLYIHFLIYKWDPSSTWLIGLLCGLKE